MVNNPNPVSFRFLKRRKNIPFKFMGSTAHVDSMQQILSGLLDLSEAQNEIYIDLKKRILEKRNKFDLSFSGNICVISIAPEFTWSELNIISKNMMVIQQKIDQMRQEQENSEKASLRAFQELDDEHLYLEKKLDLLKKQRSNK